MLFKIHKNKAARYLPILMIMGFLAGAIGWQTEAKQQNDIAKGVMLLIPDNPKKIEEKFKPKSLIALGVLDLGVTTQWDTIQRVAESGELKALIIHHAALDKVNYAQLQTWFLQDKVVVTGLGIQGDQLAEAVRMPRGLGFPYEHGFTHTEFFYTCAYAYGVFGTPEDPARFQADSDSAAIRVAGAKNSLQRSVSAVSDSLTQDADARRMLLVTKERIEEQEKFVKASD